ncbi:protein Wnt-11b-2-like [Acanthaster planci]|uniref:Protein Wnt n=1 Tax=Acanthaster planci TaxID=133434 RepID=A0A8B7YR80_ACAPL|nr:protein Wnt-11b-2-like [Acanthaster planci]
MAPRRTNIMISGWDLFVFWTVALVSFVPYTPNAYGLKWIALTKENKNTVWTNATACKSSRLLVSPQKSLCKRNLDAMAAVVESTTVTFDTCQLQFQDRRWNCSSINSAPNFTPDLNKGTREAAFVQALSAASLAQTLALECSSGMLSRCGCGQLPLGEDKEAHPNNPQEAFRWGGCSDDVDYGIEFTTRFANGPLLTNRNRDNPRSKLNLHNNNAGLKLIESTIKRRCKCHGVSGSCNLKTCWKALPNISVIGMALKRKYSGATEVSFRRTVVRRELVPKDPQLKDYTLYDLIYLTASPDYCRQNIKAGSYGTRGRTCNRTSPRTEGCDLMCCGRGYETLVTEVTEQCRCKYNWCCYVTCDECRQIVEKDVCL